MKGILSLYPRTEATTSADQQCLGISFHSSFLPDVCEFLIDFEVGGCERKVYRTYAPEQKL